MIRSKCVRKVIKQMSEFQYEILINALISNVNAYMELVSSMEKVKLKHKGKRKKNTKVC